MNRAGLKRGVMIVMNPQTGEILAMVSLPTYDNNKFAEGISRKDFQALLKNPEKPLLNHAINEQFPPGSTYKLVTGLGVLADKKLGPTELVQTQPVHPDRTGRSSGTGTMPASVGSTSGAASPTRATRSSTRWPSGSGSSDWPTGRTSSASVRKSGIDLPGEVPGIVPTNQWKQDTFGQAIFPGEVLQAGHRTGLRHDDPAPDPQRVRGPGQRRQALPAAGRPRGRRCRRHGRPAVRAEADPQGQDHGRGTSRSCGSALARS